MPFSLSLLRPLRRLALLAATVGALVSAATEVVGWRADGSGRFPAAQPPLSWSAEAGIVWSTPMSAFSNSTPILLGNRLFVAAEVDQLLCLDADSGEILWAHATPEEDLLDEAEKARRAAVLAELAPVQQQRQELDKQMNELRRQLRQDKDNEELKNQEKALKAQADALDRQLAPLRGIERPPTHGTNGYSSQTPTTDGARVYMFFGTGVAVAFTPAGERLWARLVDRPTHGWGHSASPLLAGGHLIIQVKDVVALDPATGAEVWRTPGRSHWGTPQKARLGDQQAIVTCDGQLLNAADGRRLSDKLVALEYNSPLVQDGIVYTFNNDQARAHRLPTELAEGAAPELLWETPVAKERYYASPIWVDGIVYGVNQKSILTAIDAQTGEKLYEQKLDLGGGTVYPSPAFAGGHLFVSSDTGTTIVLKPGREYVEVGRNQVDGFRSCPTFVGGRLYLRTVKFMYCFGQ